MEADTTQELQLPLSVNLASMSQRSRAVIEYYIKSGKNQFFSIADSVDSADVVILDYDHPGSAAGLAKNPWPASVAIIVLTVSNENVEGAIMVRKPLDSTGLDGAAVKALAQLKERRIRTKTQQEDRQENASVGQKLAAKAEIPDEPQTSTRPETAAKPATSTQSAVESGQESSAKPSVRSTAHTLKTPSYFRTIEATLVRRSKLSSEEKFERYAEKIELLCGPPRTLEQLSDPEDLTHRVDLSQCLSRQIVKVSSKRSADLKAVQFKTPNASVSILFSQHKLYSSLSLEYKSNVRKLFYNFDNTETESDNNAFTVIKFDRKSVRQLVDALNQTKRYSFSLPSFCWLGTLFSARGRLPYQYDINTPCRLRHWPNLTRLELIPECMEVAAAWADNTATLPEIIKHIGCEPRYVTAFFNAACTLDLMVMNPDHEQ